MTKKHELKILPQYFNAVYSGEKTFEIRKNDTNFELGDTLVIKEYSPISDSFSGRIIEKKVTYITDYAQQKNYVVMSII